ncbi:MAG TPA: glycosyltransferase [Solirubrobacterales bacterium]|nr:glycosyltransferase [Solirubrobacterales bacterium]
MASMRAAPHSRPRIAVLKDGFVPEYRAELFARLGQMKEVEYVFFHGPAPRGTGHRAAAGPFSFPHAGFANRELRIGGRALVYQPAVRAVAGPAFDGAVLGAELKMLAHVVLFPLLKLRRKPVLLWGQGGEKGEDRGNAMKALGRAGGALKLAAARQADGYIAYTSGGRDRLVEAGADPARIFVVRNTLDVEAEIALHGRLAIEPVERLRSELGLRPDSAVLLFLGRVYPEKKLSELVRALRELRERRLTQRPVEVVVVGDGPDLARIRAEADGAEGVHFAGEIREPELVGRYLRVATAMVIPGKVGLAVNHAFAHGVPAITRVSPLHAPEFEYLEPGRNSIVADGDLGAFVAAIAEFVDSEEQQARLAAGALASREGLTVASMASSFHRAVCRTLGLDVTQ